MAHPLIGYIVFFQVKAKKIINHLVKKRIASSKVHIPNNYHPLFRNNQLPNTKKFYEHLIHIPCGFWVKQADAQKISEVIRSYDKIPLIHMCQKISAKFASLYFFQVK